MFGYNSNLEKISLKYGDKVPEGYNVSEIQFTFDFIYLVFKRDASIDGAVRGVANEYDLSEDFLMDYLIENKYILNKQDKNEFSNQLKKYNTKSLKKILKKHGLKTSGKRERLEKRLFENNLIGNSPYLSSKSRVFYKNKKRRINIFNEYLFKFYYFREFNEFYMDNYRKKVAKIPIEFIKIHINKSYEDKNHEKYILNNHIMAEHYSNKENYRKMLKYVLKNYCMNINPIWKIDGLKDHIGMDIDNYDQLRFLHEHLSKNTIISTFYLVWDSFNFDRIIVPKYDAYRYLKDILNGKDHSRINRDLDERFYMNENLKIKKITQKTLFDF